MTGPALRAIARRALRPRTADSGGSLAGLHAGAVETILWLQPPVATGEFAHARRAASLPAFGVQETHDGSLLLALAQAWSAQRHPDDLTAWTRVAEAGLASAAVGSAPTAATRITHATIALLLLRQDGALARLPAGLLARLLDRVARETDVVLRSPPDSGSERSRQLHSVYLAASVLGPGLPPRRRLLASAQARQARDRLVAALLADFRADGSHCECAPRGHLHALHTALSFVALARALDDALPPPLHARLRAALEFSLWTTLPDGGVPGSDPAVTENRATLSLGAALYWLPAIEFAASGGRSGEPPEALARSFPRARQLVARGSWHDPQAQHLVHGDALHYAIAGRRVLVGPRVSTATAAADADAFVRIGLRSTVARSTLMEAGGHARTRCFAHVLRDYVLLVDRCHAGDARLHPAGWHLQFAPEWQDRLALVQDARGVHVRGMADRPCADWQLLLDAGGGEVELVDHEDDGPALQARQSARGDCFFAAAIGPQGDTFALHALEAHHGAGRSVVCIRGESEGEPFVDRLVVHWHDPGLVLRADYLARAGLALERRRAGKLQHLLLAQACDWFSCLHPVHAAAAPDAAGDLEW